MSKKKKHRLTPPVSGNEADPSVILDLMPDFDDADDFEEDDEELEEEETATSVAPEPEASVPVSEPVEEEEPTPTPTDTLVDVLSNELEIGTEYTSEPVQEEEEEEKKEEDNPLDDIGFSVDEVLAREEQTAKVLKAANAQIEALSKECDTALTIFTLLKSKLVHIPCLKISSDVSAYNRRSNSLPLSSQEFTMLKNFFQF